MRLPTRSDVDKIVTPHRIEIQQGNFISQEMVSQLQAGQTKDQVRFILGTPLIADSFHGDRWDYVFWRIRANSRDLEQRKITVFFEAGKLKRVEGDVTPAAFRGASEIKVPEATPPAAAAAQAEAKPAAQTEQAKQASALDKPSEPPDLPEGKKRDTRSWWERLKDKMSF
jgi:outer membrane protein assembly factor BamE